MSGFNVAGMIDGCLYEVAVTGDAKQPVVGSKRVRELVKQAQGRRVLVTPYGPAYTVDAADPASVLALLADSTTVRWVGDDAPDLGAPKALNGVA